MLQIIRKGQACWLFNAAHNFNCPKRGVEVTTLLPEESSSALEVDDFYRKKGNVYTHDNMYTHVTKLTQSWHNVRFYNYLIEVQTQNHFVINVTNRALIENFST